MSDSKSDHKTLWELIKDIRFGMLTHRHDDGMLHSHPLTTQNKSLDEVLTLYFFISDKSELASGVRQDGNVNVSYSSPYDDSYVSIAGNARVVRDPAKVEQLWTPAAEAWFHGGPTDTDLALLEVDIVHAQYWNVEESKMTRILKKAKAALTGERPQPGGHKEVNVT